MKKFQVKSAVYFGNNSLHCLAVKSYQNVLVITDPFMKESGNIDLVLAHLRPEAKVTVFARIYPDPDAALIAEGMKVYLEVEPDMVIACGGGSTIDAVKSILFCCSKLKEGPAPLFVAIPTTSGTGSEVTNFSVVTMDGQKIPIVDDSLLPDVAILDAGLTETVPRTITADTGMDVLTHAIEAYVSTGASNYTDALAEKAVELVFDYLPVAVKDGSNTFAREQMHDASCMAGMAFSNASLGINHSLAHAIGGALRLPHGRANAIILPWVIAYNAADFSARKKYCQLAARLGLINQPEEEGVRQLICAVRAMQQKIQIPATFREAGISKQDFVSKLDFMSNAALKDNCTATNPVQPSVRDLETLYRNCYHGS